jgi:hypothetical protein
MAEESLTIQNEMADLQSGEESEEEDCSSGDFMEELGGDNIESVPAPQTLSPEQTHGWMGLEPCWPRRLLHIATMTSFVRDDGNAYGGHKEPKYNILSYTWGRFTNPTGRAIQINGVEWSIPAIDESHFTVEEFEAVIRQVGRDVDFVWVDIACIHQEDETVKAEDVGNQAGIFRNAHKAFIWLNRLECSTLTGCIEEICCDGMFGLMKLGHTGQLADDTTDSWTQSIKDGWESVIVALVELFGDHWFSSLWTLQESILRRDAFILSREGAYIYTSLSNRPWQYKVLAGAFQEYYGSLLPFSNIPSARERNYITRLSEARSRAQDLLAKDADIATSLCELIHHRGLSFAWTSNPNVAYCVGQYRATKYPLDRIFGIMQIYGIKVSLPKMSEDVPVQLRELEDQFGRELVKMSPLLSQMFVHAETSKPRRSWLITQKCSVPPVLDIRGARFESEKTNLCHMSVGDDGNISFCGKAWDFMELLKAISLGDSMGNTDFRQAICQILQNHGLPSSDNIPPQSASLDPLTTADIAAFHPVRPPGFRAQSREIRLRPSTDAPQVSILLDRHRELPAGALDPELDFIEPGSRYRDEELYTLMVGIQVARVYGEDNLRVLLLGQIPHAGLNVNIGVVLLRCGAGPQNAAANRWERIGLVVWHVIPSQYDLRKEESTAPLPPWSKLEGEIL